MHESEQERYDALRTMLEMPHRLIDVGFCPLPGAMIDAYERAAEDATAGSLRRGHSWNGPILESGPCFRARAERSAWFSGGRLAPCWRVSPNSCRNAKFFDPRRGAVALGEVKD